MNCAININGLYGVWSALFSVSVVSSLTRNKQPKVDGCHLQVRIRIFVYLLQTVTERV